MTIVVGLAACGGGPTVPSSVQPNAATALATAAPATAAPIPSVVGGDDWATFAHDQARTSTETLPTGISAATVSQLQLAWVYQSATSFDVAGPIAVNDTVYVGDLSGNLTALSAQTGTVLWKRALGVTMKMTPAYADGMLFVGTFNEATPTASSSFMALDPTTGNTLWSAAIDGGVHGPPVIANGLVYVPVSLGDPGFCHPGGVVALSERTGAREATWLTDPTNVPNGGGVWSALSYDGTRLYYGTGNVCSGGALTANAIVSVSPALTQNWYQNTASPLSEDDVGGAVLVQGSTGYVNGKNGVLYALDLATGGVEWSKQLGAPDTFGGFSTPVYADGTLVASGGYQANPYTSATNGGLLYGLTSSGGVQWKLMPPVPIFQPVAATSDLFFTTWGANAAALDPATGKTIWQSPLVGVSRTSPIVVPSGLYVADMSGRLYAFKLPSKETASQRRRTVVLPMDERRTSARFSGLIPIFCKGA